MEIHRGHCCNLIVHGAETEIRGVLSLDMSWRAEQRVLAGRRRFSMTKGFWLLAQIREIMFNGSSSELGLSG